jgi:hypothetical protein
MTDTEQTTDTTDRDDVRLAALADLSAENRALRQCIGELEQKAAPERIDAEEQRRRWGTEMLEGLTRGGRP